MQPNRTKSYLCYYKIKLYFCNQKKEVVQMIADGTYGGTSFVIDLANGGEVMDFNSAYDLPADVKSLATDTVKGIIDGSITIVLGE